MARLKVEKKEMKMKAVRKDILMAGEMAGEMVFLRVEYLDVGMVEKLVILMARVKV